jgi:hypothetical protein
LNAGIVPDAAFELFPVRRVRFVRNNRPAQLEELSGYGAEVRTNVDEHRPRSVDASRCEARDDLGLFNPVSVGKFALDSPQSSGDWNW